MDEFTGEPPRPEGGGLDDDPGPRGRWVGERWRPASVDRPTGGAGRIDPVDQPDESGSVTGDGNGNGARSDGEGTSARPAGGGRGRWDRGCRSTGPVEGLAAEVVAVLEALAGPEGLDDESLAEAVTGLVRVRSLLDAVTAGFVARWDARRLWADDGSRSAGARLGRDAGCRRQSGTRMVHVARSLRSMPLVADAWQAGRISTDHVERLVRAATPERAGEFAEAEARLVTVAELGHWSVFDKAVAMFETGADDRRTDPTNPDDVAKRAKKERAHRNARPVRIGDRFEIMGSLDKKGGQIFSDTWERIRHELWEQDMAQARRACGPDATNAEIAAAVAEIRTPAQRCADALVEMATRAGTAPADGQRPRPLITVVVSKDELMGPIRELFNGLVLSRLEIAQLLFEADFERIVFGPTGQPVEVASTQRFFTGGWRRAVEVRDRVCQHPTCDITAEYCQVDHIIEHADGGPTSVANGRLLCPQHNHQRPGRKPPPASRRDRGDGGSGSGEGNAERGDDGDPDQP